MRASVNQAIEVVYESKIMFHLYLYVKEEEFNGYLVDYVPTGT